MPKIKKSEEKKEQKNNGNPAGWDISCPKDKCPQDIINKFLKENCKNYVYQLESGTQGYLHWQIRCRFRKGMRAGEIGNLLAAYNLTGHASITCGIIFKTKNFNYVMKTDSRQDGPWSDKDVPPDEPKDDIPILVVTEKAKARYTNYTLRPWQAKVVKLATTPDEDCIDLIYDPDGLNGKSRLHNWLMAHGLAMMIPCMNDLTKMVGFVVKMGEQPCFTGDIPRAFNKKGLALNEYFAAIEQIKTGCVYEWRYTTKILIMERPNIILFTNNKLPKDCLTGRRLRFWHIKNGDLYKGLEDGDEDIDDIEEDGVVLPSLRSAPPYGQRPPGGPSDLIGAAPPTAWGPPEMKE